jgi:hypothetical protein
MITATTRHTSAVPPRELLRIGKSDDSIVDAMVSQGDEPQA